MSESRGTQHRYQPFYCEENAYYLAQHRVLNGRDPHVVFISNRIKQCLLMKQRAAAPDRPVCWDYHAIVVADDPPEAWDLDTRLGMPVPLDRYLDETFPAMLPDLEILVRAVPVADMIDTFMSDRSHMRRDDGSYMSPPPGWDPIGTSSNLMRFIDMTDDIAGEVMDLAALRARYSR